MNKIKDLLLHAAILLVSIPIASIIAAMPATLAIFILKECVYDFIFFNDSEFTLDLDSIHLMLSRVLIIVLTFAYLLLIAKNKK